MDESATCFVSGTTPYMATACAVQRGPRRADMFFHQDFIKVFSSDSPGGYNLRLLGSSIETAVWPCDSLMLGSCRGSCSNFGPCLSQIISQAFCIDPCCPTNGALRGATEQAVLFEGYKDQREDGLSASLISSGSHGPCFGAPRRISLSKVCSCTFTRHFGRVKPPT